MVTNTSEASRRVAINSIVPFTATMAGRILSWGMAVVMARTLGPEGTGAYAFAVNLWLYASIISDFGLGTWLTREIARSPERASDAVRLSLGLRLALSIAAGLTLVLVVLTYAALGIGDVDREIVATAALLAVGLLPGAFSAAGTALFNAHQRMVFPATIQLGSAALTTVLGAAALLNGFGIVALGWVSLAVNVVTAAIFMTASVRQYVPLDISLWPRRQLKLARETLPLMLNGLLNNVFFRIDIQVLQSQGSAIVGNYANAYKVIDAAGAVPSSFVLALFPVLSRRRRGRWKGGAVPRLRARAQTATDRGARDRHSRNSLCLGGHTPFLGTGVSPALSCRAPDSGLVPTAEFLQRPDAVRPYRTWASGAHHPRVCARRRV